MNLLPNKSQIDRVFFAIVFVAVAFSTVTVTNTAVAQGAQVRDPLLHAMETELAREKALLLLPGMQRPYFIEYRLDDMNTYEAVATYGALAREEANRQRIVRVTVRIGDYVFDSSSSKGEGTVELAPTDDNPEALRYALWIATDTAYKNALRAYAAKQAALKQFQSSQMEHAFAEAKPEVHIAPLVTMDLDRKEWKRRIIEASGLYATAPEVRASAAQVQYST